MDNMIFKDPKEVFNKAISDKCLSIKDNETNYAGSYMYMYSDNEFDYFKNIITREYIKNKT